MTSSHERFGFEIRPQPLNQVVEVRGLLRDSG